MKAILVTEGLMENRDFLNALKRLRNVAFEMAGSGSELLDGYPSISDDPIKLAEVSGIVWPLRERLCAIVEDEGQSDLRRGLQKSLERALPQPGSVTVSDVIECFVESVLAPRWAALRFPALINRDDYEEWDGYWKELFISSLESRGHKAQLEEGLYESYEEGCTELVSEKTKNYRLGSSFLDVYLTPVQEESVEMRRWREEQVDVRGVQVHLAGLCSDGAFKAARQKVKGLFRILFAGVGRLPRAESSEQSWGRLRAIEAACSALWASNAKNKYAAKHVHQAIGLLAEADQTSNNAIALLLYVSAMETLLAGASGSHSISDVVSRNAALLLCDRAENRGRCADRVKELYNTRSRVTHQGLQDVEDATRRRGQNAAIGALFGVLFWMQQVQESVSGRILHGSLSAGERDAFFRIQPGR